MEDTRCFVCMNPPRYHSGAYGCLSWSQLGSHFCVDVDCVWCQVYVICVCVCVYVCTYTGTCGCSEVCRYERERQRETKREREEERESEREREGERGIKENHLTL